MKFIRSHFEDTNADGIGDFQGIIRIVELRAADEDDSVADEVLMEAPVGIRGAVRRNQ